MEAGRAPGAAPLSGNPLTVNLPARQASSPRMGQDERADYVCTVSRRLAGAGRTVWRWAVRRHDGEAAVASGTSIRSEDDAKAAALKAIDRLRGSDRENGPAARKIRDDETERYR